MKGLLTPLNTEPARVEGVTWNGKLFRLLAALIYNTKSKVKITVPAGFVTNFATWIRPTGRWIEATVVHDFLYSKEGYEAYGFTRKEADEVFKEMMTRAGCPRWRINAFYYAVRVFGGFNYEGK